ncbi:MAG: hypothetical protein UW43_C0007G0003 [Candidatus Yanofskybacteria bacterium GW2011_GWA1_44_21]|uniref:tRNA threonylcarbamoyladenosine biosynthesis protein TsaE n=2 Tax=Candidatus Yanofskyibacteriota TaxID=1752733 RepID=A0A1F8H1X8_9BACT|nr:MAG: hypothetical protein UW14_C0007G0035 [Candidatus Yanofskybacteria bacterium GW2011_GWA2_44_10]KKT50386.1 MAG: hypothetical protein UW43_C0007G0003 [Candidatus Yanofskybacteria bacterium GW2011_GWA1_44_21]KKT89979.1 MAG: hypothetical protein UW90_C0009G0003 [Candidatus Yanofskybacteria bacterium GW2011_GWB1_45_11]OGN03367.1 MAG: tRNA (adenosine(37)-N6)-threonylcarbamoyltransferase complex ATPase subunit type 1 TsaE [Candidatus Yanofskybacteria bacterium RIFCSPHIGHO2_01_FULL_44_110b]OGN14
MKEVFISKNVSETKKKAANFAERILNIESNGAIVIALEGELGAGKTTFIQGFVSGCGIKEKVKSPTFNILKKYGERIYHLDCYRLKDENDLRAFDLKEIFNDSGNIVLIEWAERVSKILPGNHWKIHIDHISENERKIEISFN